MTLNQQDKKNLQTLMKTPQWASVNTAVKTYLMEHFVTTSIKRENEFETMWQLSFSEGGKDNIQRLMSELLAAAKQV